MCPKIQNPQIIIFFIRMGITLMLSKKGCRERRVKIKLVKKNIKSTNQSIYDAGKDHHLVTKEGIKKGV